MGKTRIPRVGEPRAVKKKKKRGMSPEAEAGPHSRALSLGAAKKRGLHPDAEAGPLSRGPRAAKERGWSPAGEAGRHSRAPGAAKERGLSPAGEAGRHSLAPGAAKEMGLSPEAEAVKRRSLSPEEATPIFDVFVPATKRAAKGRCLPTYGEGDRSGTGGEERGNVTGWGCVELETMTKTDRIPDCGTETERGVSKKRNLPGDQAALGHAHPETRGVRDGENEYVTETDGAQVHEMTKAGGAVDEGEGKEEMEELSSFTPGSPISMPYIPGELNDPTAYPATLAAFKDAQVKYEAKLGHRYRLFTLPHQPRYSCLFHLGHLIPIREAAKKAVLHAAKFVIRLSSSVEGKSLATCCGLWIKRGDESKTGIVLTTAHLIRSKHPTENHWEGRDEYNIKANVIVHLPDGTTAEAHYLYHQEHYDLAFFKVRVDEPVKFASFSGSMRCGEDVFLLGRDEHMNLSINHGMVEDQNPASYERHHYMYFFYQKTAIFSLERNDDYLPDDDYVCHDDGGSIINLAGEVIGLVNKHSITSFVPSCILDKCVDMWCKFGYIPRLHLGMKFTSIKLLDPIHIEKIWHMYKIEDGLIVKEVSKESHAEKLGICLGDIIERFNGECISTTVELENMLLGRCRELLDQRDHLNEQIDVSIQVFHTEQRLRRNINLTVDVSDAVEVVKRRTYPITAIEGTSALGQSSQNVADDPSLPRPKLTWDNYTWHRRKKNEVPQQDGLKNKQ